MIDNYKREFLKEYNTVDESINHIKSIIKLIEEYQKIRKESKVKENV